MADTIASSLGAGVPLPTAGSVVMPVPQTALLDMFIPGFSVFSEIVQRYLHIDLNLYIPMVIVASGFIFCWGYFSSLFWDIIKSYCMSSVDIRTDDELYNYIMAWVAGQNFSKDSRRSIANTNVNSRSWFLFRWDRDDDDEGDGTGSKRKSLAYTPTFGSHYFWYRGRLLIFRRNQNRDQATFLAVSEREEVSLSCFGRNPWILKELLHEAREVYVKKDESKTLIYRGTTKGGSTEPTWQRCMARTSRPFSTVILNEKVKKDLIDDVTDYLNPATRRWYSNRGIPYRRGYLLYGPPGTGKSSLSLALAGFFKMRIYIVSLSSVTANEENLSSLFAELPRRCVVLLEDIDTAGLTHTREGQEPGTDDEVVEDQQAASSATSKKQKKKGGGGGGSAPNGGNTPIGRLSLSGLLNILDGVASQEGRVLIMTTNHIEKLDKALIRPGRVDMIVKFDRSDRDMTAAIFRAIYAPLEGDDVASASDLNINVAKTRTLFNFKSSATAAAELEEKEKKAAEEKKREEDGVRERKENVAKVERLAGEFADRIPTHEFSPAEIQGYLLKNKRDPARAVEGAEAWVVEARREKREKELKDAEEKRKKELKEAEEKKAEEEKKKKKEKSKKQGKNAKGKKGRKTTKKSGSDESEQESESESGSSSEKSESEPEEEGKVSKAKKSTAKVEADKKSAEEQTSEDAGAGEEEATETAASEPVKEPSPAGAEDKLLAEEKKHGGDSGYGTP
jgi:chaperone BCS1